MSDDDDFGECSKRDEDLTLPKGMDACALRLLAWKCMLHLRSIRRGAALDALTKRVVLGAATVSKMIKEMLPNDIRCANDTRDLILDCCVGTLLLCLSQQCEAQSRHVQSSFTLSRRKRTKCVIKRARRR